MGTGIAREFLDQRGGLLSAFFILLWKLLVRDQCGDECRLPVVFRQRREGESEQRQSDERDGARDRGQARTHLVPRPECEDHEPDKCAGERTAEMGCDGLAKATQVDGVYSADPKKFAGATRYDRLTYDEVLQRNLQVMDMAAIALARDNDMPLIVFSIEESGNLARLLTGEARATTIAAGAGPA